MNPRALGPLVTSRLALAGIAALVVAIQPAAVARAQVECADGRVASEATGGRCCWPGQTFSEQHGRCAGPPRCPEGWVAEGDTCLQARTTATTVRPAQPPPFVAPDAAGGAGGLLWPREPDLESAVVDPIVVEGTDDGILALGLALFGAGYLGGVLMGLADESARNCADFSGPFGFTPTGCGSWPLTLIPVAGGMAGTLASFTSSRQSVTLGVTVGPIVGIVQIVGIVFLTYAIAVPTRDVVPSIEVGDARVSLSPYGGSDAGGLVIGVEL